VAATKQNKTKSKGVISGLLCPNNEVRVHVCHHSPFSHRAFFRGPPQPNFFPFNLNPHCFLLFQPTAIILNSLKFMPNSCFSCFLNKYHFLSNPSSLARIPDLRPASHISFFFFFTLNYHRFKFCLLQLQTIKSTCQIGKQPNQLFSTFNGNLVRQGSFVVSIGMFSLSQK